MVAHCGTKVFSAADGHLLTASKSEVMKLRLLYRGFEPA